MHDKLQRNTHMHLSKFGSIYRLGSLLLLLALFGGSGRLLALDNGLAKTPPMGWNTWEKFGCNVSEQLIRETTDAMVRSGMKAAGYEYVVIDDCWQVGRDDNGDIIPDPKRFPSGMKALADYVHSKGLKFGLYSDAGTATCQDRPGSRGYEFQDARQYAAWGVDYLKYDWCHHGTQDSIASYATMRDALLKAKRPMVFSICEWGTTKPWLWGKDIGNLWRATGDIINKWDGHAVWGGNGVVQIIDLMNGIESYAGPGHWNDPDMLEVGNGGMTDTEYRAHLSMWAMFAAPLIAGNDIRNMDQATNEILTNRDVIAVDQDPLGHAGRRIWKDGNREVWSRELADGGRAVALLNRDTAEQKIAVQFVDIGYPNHLSASVRDLWAHEDLGRFAGTFSAAVPAHGAVLVRITP